MQIYGKPVQRIGQIYEGQKKTVSKKSQEQKNGSQDRVTLSNQGKEIQAVLRQVSEAPDIRPEVETIRLAVSSGTYQVSGEDVAASILKKV